MAAVARILFSRVNVYAAALGCVFSGFSSTPLNGQFLTLFADRYFDDRRDAECAGLT